LRTSVEEIFLTVPAAVTGQLEDSASRALKITFEELLKPIVETAREKAARRGGWSAPKIRDKEIFEAKEAVWQREFGPEGHFLSFLRFLTLSSMLPGYRWDLSLSRV
jgi:hypothetical protein